MSKQSSEKKSDKASEVTTEQNKVEMDNAVKDVVDAKYITVTSAEMWEPASAVVAQHKIIRADESVLVFDIKGIPQTVYYRIIKETTPMDVPEMDVPQLDVRGNPVAGKPMMKVPNPQDEAYLANVEEMRKKRVVQIIDAALTFDIPGATWQEKSDWLQDRLPGDVDELYFSIDKLLYNRLSSKFGEFL